MLLLAQAGQAATSNATAEAVGFWIIAVLAVGSALAVITMRNIVHAALMLVLNLLAIAGMYLLVQSQFLGIIQVIVYAGAIVVLFLFVIMLLGVDRDDLLFDLKTWHKVAAGLGGAALAGLLLFAFAGTYTSAASRCGGQAAEQTNPSSSAQPCVGLDEALVNSRNGSVGFVAGRLFNRYTFPFEAAALLLTVATIGALILGRRNDPPPGDDPAYEPTGRRPTDEDVEQVGALIGARTSTGPEGEPGAGEANEWHGTEDRRDDTEND